jgi:hypothetical protein
MTVRVAASTGYRTRWDRNECHCREACGRVGIENRAFNDFSWIVRLLKGVSDRCLPGRVSETVLGARRLAFDLLETIKGVSIGFNGFVGFLATQ